jgi:hypothetical protein
MIAKEHTPVLIVGAGGAGIASDRAMLVRPDRFVAWRISGLNESVVGTQMLLNRVFSQILGQSARSTSAKANLVAVE